MHSGRSVLLSTFVVIVLVTYVKGGRFLPKPEGPPRNITSLDRIIVHGYPAEWHSVETYDGYKLRIIRIPHSSKDDTNSLLNRRRPVVILTHGMRSSSDIFLLTGPNSGLPFLFADVGYDVWLTNARGNTYSRRHRKFAPNTRKFWHFGWHEIGEIDTAAIIDYILDLTGEEKVHFVGHSQGTTAYLVLMSMRPEYNDKIKTAHLLAPVAFLRNSKSTTITELAQYLGYPGKWSNMVINREMYPGNAYLQRIFDMACGGEANLSRACEQIFDFFMDGDIGNLNMTLVPQYVQTHPAGASTNQLLHYNQIYLTDEFLQFNYGLDENMKRYGQPNPPRYALDKVSSAVYIYYSDYDTVSPSADAQRLASKLPNVKRDYRVNFPSWTHIDFLLGLDVKRQINDPIIQACTDYDRLNS